LQGRRLVRELVERGNCVGGVHQGRAASQPASRQRFTPEFKLEAVKLIKERGVSVPRASRDLDVYKNALRKWLREAAADPQEAFPGNGVMNPEQAEFERLKKETRSSGWSATS
jgi:transposase